MSAIVLDNLTIVGGGVRDGSFEYDEDFTDEDIEALIAWRDKHVNAKPSKADDEAALLADTDFDEADSDDEVALLADTDFDEADSDDEVDEDTGEIAVKPRARLPFPVVVRSLSRLKMMTWTRTRTRRRLRAVVRRRPLRGAVVSRLLSEV